MSGVQPGNERAEGAIPGAQPGREDMKTSLYLCAGAALATAVATGADAKDLVYGSWLGVTNRTNTEALVPYFEMVKEDTGGEINWQMVGGSQLASGAGTPEAVANGLMDAGLVMAPYQPRMLPATNLIFSQSLVGEDLVASVGAMNETLMLGCDECQQEFRENNAVGFAGYGVSPYLFMCRGEPRTIEDLAELKIRGSGGGVSIIEILGGTPISMTGNEFTAAMERGALDCVLGSVQWLNSFGLMEMTDTVIDAPMGMGGPPVMMYVNRDVWEGMTPEQRQALAAGPYRPRPRPGADGDVRRPDPLGREGDRRGQGERHHFHRGRAGIRRGDEEARRDRRQSAEVPRCPLARGLFQGRPGRALTGPARVPAGPPLDMDGGTRRQAGS